MSSEDEGGPVKPRDRSFNFAEKIGKLEGTVEGLQSRFDILALGDRSSADTMSKNKLSFSGRAAENVEDLIVQLKFLKLANNWSTDQLFGNTLVTFKGDALSWYKSSDQSTFLKDGKPDFDLLVTALKDRFKSHQTQGDILYAIFDNKQKIGEPVAEYVSRMLPMFAKVTDIAEEVKVSLLVNGFVSAVGDQLKLRSDLTDVAQVELWARKLEAMTFVKASNTSFPNVGSVSYAEDVNYAGASARPQQGPCFRCGGGHLQRDCVDVNYAGAVARPQQGPCFRCGGGHLKRDCVYNFSNTQRRPSARGRGSRYNFRAQYSAYVPRPAAPVGRYPRGVYNYRPQMSRGHGYGANNQGFNPRGYGTQFRPRYGGRGPRYGQQYAPGNNYYENVNFTECVGAADGVPYADYAGYVDNSGLTHYDAPEMHYDAPLAPEMHGAGPSHVHDATH